MTPYHPEFRRRYGVVLFLSDLKCLVHGEGKNHALCFGFQTEFCIDCVHDGVLDGVSGKDCHDFLFGLEIEAVELFGGFVRSKTSTDDGAAGRTCLTCLLHDGIGVALIDRNQDETVFVRFS